MPTNTQLQYAPLLVNAGLDEEQAVIYEILLKEGELPARKIYQKTPYKRGLIYKKLEELEKLGLVVRHDAPNQISMFEPQHPSKLKELAEGRVEKAKNAETALTGIIDSLTSDFNLISGKPGVRVYEGREGIIKVARDSLTTKNEILTYIDNEAVNKFLPDFNKEYVANRDKLGIKKRMISIDNAYTRKRAKEVDRESTHMRLVPGKFPFATVMQIYDNKIGYLTLTDKKMIGVVIEDKQIAQMHRALFEYTWSTAIDPLEEKAKQPPATALT